MQLILVIINALLPITNKLQFHVTTICQDVSIDIYLSATPQNSSQQRQLERQIFFFKMFFCGKETTKVISPKLKLSPQRKFSPVDPTHEHDECTKQFLQFPTSVITDSDVRFDFEFVAFVEVTFMMQRWWILLKITLSLRQHKWVTIERFKCRLFQK